MFFAFVYLFQSSLVILFGFLLGLLFRVIVSLCMAIRSFRSLFTFLFGWEFSFLLLFILSLILLCSVFLAFCFCTSLVVSLQLISLIGFLFPCLFSFLPCFSILVFSCLLFNLFSSLLGFIYFTTSVPSSWLILFVFLLVSLL